LGEGVTKSPLSTSPVVFGPAFFFFGSDFVPISGLPDLESGHFVPGTADREGKIMILFDPIGRSAKKIVQNDHLRSADRADEIGTLPELLEIGQPGDHAPDQPISSRRENHAYHSYTTSSLQRAHAAWRR